MALPHLEHCNLSGDGVLLHAVRSGAARDGSLVILLHGFPDYWYCWRRQLEFLGAAGYRVVALDQRGYNRSDKPNGVESYSLDALGRDVIAVMDGLGTKRAAIVGHDWGGAVGWWLALNRPDRLSHLAVLNCPHPLAMQAALEGSWGQLARSWYILAAQIPGLPEAAARWTDYGLLTRSMRRSARPGTFTDRDFARYRRAWRRPGAMTAMVNWYRAATRYPTQSSSRVRVPTLLLWGMRDRFLGRDLATTSANLCEKVRVVPFPEASHWLPHEEPDRVNRLLAEFLASEDHSLPVRASFHHDPRVRHHELANFVG